MLEGATARLAKGADWEYSFPVIGRRLAQYEIKAHLGSGGMGDVYRATDTKLGRSVALKFLRDDVADDPRRAARFRREAKTLASLNHPHIAAIHDQEEADGRTFLVMEFVPGETLEERVAGRPLPVAEVTSIALQIIDALEAAHEQGIVHRDLKPANVKITPDGRVKVLDFGLAQAAADDTDAPGDDRLDDAATLTLPRTGTMVIVGTPAYMSPEQAKGLRVDGRTDIFAFGCVLFEMLTGRRAFEGSNSAEIVSCVLQREPDWTLLPSDMPGSMQRLLRLCLEKDLRRRRQSVADVRVDLELVKTEPAPSATQAIARPSWLWTATGALALAALVGVAGWFIGRQLPTGATAGVARLTVPFLETPTGLPFGTVHLAISDDGSRIAYAGNRLWIRQITRDEPIVVAEMAIDPFFSPDGEWVGFFSENGGLRKVPTGGGPSQLLATTERPAGAAWREDGTIVFATTQGLFQVSAVGGDARQLTAPDRSRRERLYAWPQFLPDRESVLFSVFSEDSSPQIVQMNLKTLARKNIVGGSAARYVAPNRLVFVSGGALKAVRFNSGTGQVDGEPVTIPGVDPAYAADYGAANYAISATGTLVFTPARGVIGRSPDLQGGLRTLQWLDARGNKEQIAVKAGSYAYPRVSPDGTRVALDVVGTENRDIWILDLARLSPTQLTNGPTEDMVPVWSPDGTRIFFASDRTGDFDIYSQAAEGATGPRLELKVPGMQAPSGFSRDGKQMVVYNLFRDLAISTLGQPDHLEPLLVTDADERLGVVSPDGRWLAYESDESGKQFEIFVRPFPNVTAGREKISVDGGRYPLWDPKGKRIYYVNLDGGMMAASLTLSPTLKVGEVTKLFDWQKPPAGRSARPYDISPIDGRFIVTEPIDAARQGPTQVSIILNWVSELSRSLAAN